MQSLLSWLVEDDKATLLAVWSALGALCKSVLSTSNQNSGSFPWQPDFSESDLSVYMQSLLSWLVEEDKATLLAVWSALEALCKALFEYKRLKTCHLMLVV